MIAPHARMVPRCSTKRNGCVLPSLIRGTMTLLVEEIRLLELRIAQLERELTVLARQSPACTTLLSIPGVGLPTATAMVAATSGTVGHFRDARHFASWFGLTPKDIRPAQRAISGVSPNAVIATCACFLPMAPRASPRD